MNKVIAFILLLFCLSCSDVTEFDPVYPNSVNDSIVFVQLCDVQLGFSNYEEDLEKFETAVLRINEINPDFVVVCGDFVNASNDSSNGDFIEIVIW